MVGDRRQRRTWRARGAVLLCLLWGMGVDVAPLAHLAFHEAFGEHRHDAWLDGMLEDEHCHEDACHAHDAANEDRPAESPFEHGRGSLTHHDLATSAPPLALPHVPDAPRVETEHAAFHVALVARDPRHPARARAPPI